MEQYSIEDKTRIITEFLEKVEKKNIENGGKKEAGGKQAAIKVLDTLIDELKRNILDKDLEGCKYHIAEIEKFARDVKEKGWDVPDKVMENYNQIREKYLNLINPL